MTACRGPEFCMDDLCRNADVGLCGIPRGLCAWCDQAVLGSHVLVGGYLWHLDCRDEARADGTDTPQQAAP